MEATCFLCRESRLCLLSVGILLLDVESVFARRTKEYLSRALLPLLKVVERAKFLESAATKFNSWLCLVPAG